MCNRSEVECRHARMLAQAVGHRRKLRCFARRSSFALNGAVAYGKGRMCHLLCVLHA